MSILISWLGPLRAICMAIDGVAFSLLDNAYNIVIELSSATILEHDVIKKMMSSIYILFGVVAFFRLALVLVNSIIDPEKLNEKGKGLSNIFFRVVGMIIILAVTPWLFEQSYEIQKRIVSSDANKNVIFSLILGNNSNIGGYDKNGYNAGKALQNVVLSSLITIDNRYLVKEGAVCTINADGEYVDSEGNVVSDLNSNCGFVPLTCVPGSDGTSCTMQGGYIYDEKTCDWKNCHNAVDKYNKMYVNEDMSPGSLAGSVGVSKKLDVGGDEKEEVYVYDYMLIVSTIAGIAMTWIILSFAIDIAVRMFELVVLEILAPLFIATFVDPKSTQSGPFKNWISAVGKSYASLYIKLGILAIMTLLIMVVNQSEVFNNMRGEVSGFAKIFVIFGLLIFAKKAPKWIMDILGIKGDGLGGLYSPSKLKDAMLGGALAAKAAKGIAGSSFAAGKNLANIARNNREARKKLTGHSSRRGARRAIEDDKAYRDSLYRANRANGMKAADAKKAADAAALAKRNADLEALNKISGAKASAAQLGSALFNAAGSFNAAAKADKLTGALKVGNDSANQFKGSKGLEGKTVFERFNEEKIKPFKSSINTAAFGDATAIAERADRIKKEKFIRDNYDAKWLKDMESVLPGFDATKLVNGKGKGLGYASTADGDDIANFDHYLRSMIAQASGYSVKYEKENGKIKINDKTGMPIIHYEKDGVQASAEIESKIAEQAKHSLSNEGAAKLQEIFNLKTANLLSDYGKNEGNISTVTQDLNNIRSDLSKVITSFSSKLTDSLKGLNSNILNAFDNQSIGNIHIDFSKISGLSDEMQQKLNQQSLNSEGINKMLEIINSDSSFSSSTDGQQLTQLLNTINGPDGLVVQNENYNSYNRLMVNKTDELRTYLNRQDSMSAAYAAAGYKMADGGKILFEGEGLEKEIAAVSNVSYAERQRKQQSQDGRIKDQIELIEKKKAEEGKK